MATIKYKDTTIPVEAGQTVTLNTTGKKFTEDIEVTAPKESGGGAEIYSIDWDFTMVETPSWAEFYVFVAPPSIILGQTISAAFFSTTIPLDITNSNCDVSLTYYTVSNISLPTGAFSGHLVILNISNPTGDINIHLSFSTGGSN